MNYFMSSKLIKGVEDCNTFASWSGVNPKCFEKTQLDTSNYALFALWLLCDYRRTGQNKLGAKQTKLSLRF